MIYIYNNDHMASISYKYSYEEHISFFKYSFQDIIRIENTYHDWFD